MKNLIKVDRTVAQLVKNEIKRQKQGLVMIPSENYASLAVLEATGSPLSNKYAEGYPGRRYYSGNFFIDQIESLAIRRLKNLFGAEYANVQPHSGSQANMACYFAFLEPGDKVMAMDLSSGGHLTHGAQVSFSGRFFKFVHYGVRRDSQLIDYEEVRQIALKEKPKMIISGASAYPRQIDFKKFSKIAQEIQAIHLADIAHLAGLIAAKVHPSPLPHTPVVTSTTQKTLRGPRGGFILTTKELGPLIDKNVFPGIQGGPLENNIAAKAVCFKEAMSQKFKKYQQQVVKNARVLAQSLKENGLDLVTDGTDNHLILIDLTKTGRSGQEVQNDLEEVGIYVNKNVIPYEIRKPWDPSGIRLGTPALTTQGMKEKEMKLIGEIMAKIIFSPQKTKIKKEAKNLVSDLTQKFLIYPEI